MIRASRLFAVVLVLLHAGIASLAQAQDSSDVETVRYEWDLTEIYPTVEAWEEALDSVSDRIETLSRYRGTLDNGAANLADALEAQSDTAREAYRVYVYTSLMRDVDQREPAAQERFGRARQMLTNLDQATSWVRPEILDLGGDTIRSFRQQESRLEKFGFLLDDILRQEPHTLDQRTEALLAQAGMVLSAPQQIYENYANADIPWPTVTLSDGTEATLSQAGYSFWRAVPNRDDRKLVFDTFWGAWNQYADGLPPEIYTQLVTQVNDALPLFHRYLELRGRLLGIEDLRYYDIYPPLVQAETGVFDLERAEEITFAALEPFGEEYLELLAYGLSRQWMHSHPQPGKRSGAYMNGSIYDVHPYVLLNHNDDYESTSTFAHEWGHAVHSLLANANNPFETAGYSTFTAEIASTINEILLQEYMIANATTDAERLFYLSGALEQIRGTLFRQTMFAEFELAIHRAAERGEPLTGPRLTEIYGDLLKRYHAHDLGVLTIDDAYTVEWAFIPHFYYDFYVFQYATSISGAAWFAEQFLAGDEAVRDAFIRVLSAGGSDYPHNILLNEAGLDMTQAEAYEPVLRRMEDLMDRIEGLL